jgi:hypothetical protein
LPAVSGTCLRRLCGTPGGGRQPRSGRRSAGAVANALDKLVSLGTAQMVTDKPRTYRLAPAAPARDEAGGPAADAEPAASAA